MSRMLDSAEPTRLNALTNQPTSSHRPSDTMANNGKIAPAEFEILMNQIMNVSDIRRGDLPARYWDKIADKLDHINATLEGNHGAGAFCGGTWTMGLAHGFTRKHYNAMTMFFCGAFRPDDAQHTPLEIKDNGGYHGMFINQNGKGVVAGYSLTNNIAAIDKIFSNGPEVNRVLGKMHCVWNVTGMHPADIVAGRLGTSLRNLGNNIHHNLAVLNADYPAVPNAVVDFPIRDMQNNGNEWISTQGKGMGKGHNNANGNAAQHQNAPPPPAPVQVPVPVQVHAAPIVANMQANANHGDILQHPDIIAMIARGNIQSPATNAIRAYYSYHGDHHNKLVRDVLIAMLNEQNNTHAIN